MKATRKLEKTGAKTARRQTVECRFEPVCSFRLVIQFRAVEQPSTNKKENENNPYPYRHRRPLRCRHV